MTTFERIDIRAEITNKIVGYLEKGIKPWECPYFSNLPMNMTTNKQYSGINFLMLNIASVEKNYNSNKWLSYQQAKALGGNIKKGEKGTHIIFYSTLETENAKGEEKIIPFLKHYSIFNLDQCEKIEDKEIKVRQEINKDEAIDSFVSKIQPNIEINDKKLPCYSPSQDKIYMPTNFKNTVGYYSTLLHELSHWTGHESRLNRLDKLSRFGNQTYAMEELVAELSSAFLCSHFNLDVKIEDHGDYIGSWLKILKNDSKAIFTAAARAQEVCNYLKLDSCLMKAA